METHPYYGPGNIVVDTCSECGYLWLDHGEISRVENASFVRRSAPYTWDSPAETVSERLQSAGLSPVADKPEDSPSRVLGNLLFSPDLSLQPGLLVSPLRVLADLLFT
jgi:hypothetical protein